MTEMQMKLKRIFKAWMERWGISVSEASDRLSKYRKVSPEQVQKILDGEICPSVETFNDWAPEINSSPTEKREAKGPEFDSDIFSQFGDIFGGGGSPFGGRR